MISRAISNIIYLKHVKSDTSVSDGCCCFSYVSTEDDLPLLLNPNEFDTVIIENGSNGGVDMAIYHQGNWVIKHLKGEKGERGLRGFIGKNGKDGKDGKDGSRGEIGSSPEHRWATKTVNGVLKYLLQFKNPDGSWGTLIDLYGKDGKDGKNGQDGAKGDKPNHKWKNTSLRFELPDGSWGNWSDLKGDKGDNGLPPEHEINGNSIRFKNPDGSWGDWLEMVSNDLFDGADIKCLNTTQKNWDDSTPKEKIEILIDNICAESPNNWVSYKIKMADMVNDTIYLILPKYLANLNSYILSIKNGSENSAGDEVLSGYTSKAISNNKIKIQFSSTLLLLAEWLYIDVSYVTDSTTINIS